MRRFQETVRYLSSCSRTFWPARLDGERNRAHWVWRSFLAFAVMVSACPAAVAGSIAFPNTALGATSASQAVTVTLPGGGTPATIEVLTQGVANLDFIDASGGSCSVGVPYAAAATCTVNVAFTPQNGGALYGAVVLLDGSGVPLATEYVTGTGIGPALPPASAIAAQSVVPSSGINTLAGIAVDAAGNVYITDYYGNQVLKETLSGGTYTQSSIGTGFGSPAGIAVDGAGNLYIADIGNKQVVKETLSGGAYTQSLVATGLDYPQAVAVDGAGNVYVTDSVVLLETYSAGSYTQSILISDVNYSDGIAIDGAGNLYLADNTNSQVVKETLSGGVYTPTVIGNGYFLYPVGIAVDTSGNLYVGDPSLGQVVKETLSGGSYTPTTVGIGIYSPTGVALDRSGNLYIADSSVNQIDVLHFSAATNFGSLALQAPGTTATLLFTLQNGGALAATPYKVVTQGAENLDFKPASSQPSSVCITGHSYDPGDTCTVDVTFTPTQAGTRYGAAVLYSSSGTVLATGYVYGTGVAPQLAFSPASQTSISSSIGVNAYGLAVDGAGNVYIGEAVDDQVLMLPAGCIGSCTTRKTIGTGLNAPQGVAVDGAGNVYIADSGNNRVLMVPAGCTNSCSTQTVVDDNLNAPVGVAVDGAGNVYVADAGDGSIVEDIPTSGGYNQTVIDINFNNPVGVAVDDAGNLYVADSGSQEVLKDTLSGGSYTQSTIASSVQAEGIAVDGVGNLYVATDDSNIFKETPSAGTYSQSTLASLGGAALYAVALDGAGNVYVPGPFDDDVLKLGVVSAPSLLFQPTLSGTTSSDSPQTVTLTNNGNADLIFPPPGAGLNPSLSTQFTYGNTSTCPQLSTGSSPYVLAAGGSCTELLGFSPTAFGTITGSLVLTDNNLAVAGSAQSVSLSGVSTGAAMQLGFSAPPLTAVATGTSVSSLITVQEQDSSGALAAGTDTITLTVTYPDTTQQVYTATASGGAANFDLSGVTLSQTGNYTYVASASGLTSATANETVEDPVLTGIQVIFAPTSAVAGSSNAFEAYAADQFGNPFSTYSGTFSIASSDPAVQITNLGPGSFPFIALDVITFNTVGTQSLTVSATGLSSVTLSNIPVAAAPGYIVTVLTDTTSGVAAHCTDQTLPGATPDANCSLRDAIAAANDTATFVATGSATIGFSAGLASQYPATITLNGTELDVASNATITGPGSTNLAIDAQHNSGIFELGPDFTSTPDTTNIFNLSGITLANGDGTDTYGDAAIDGDPEIATLSDVVVRDSTNGTGVGFYPFPVEITVHNGTFSGNSTGGGSGLVGGGMYLPQASTATIDNTTFASNTVPTLPGGGLFADFASTVTITNSTFNGNSAYSAGGVYIEAGSTVTISNSSFTGNQATGAHAGGSAALFESDSVDVSTVRVDHSTFSGNTSTLDATILIDQAGSLLLSNSTVTGNSVTGDGGGVYNEAASVTVQQSTIAANTAGNFGGAIYNDGGTTTLVNATVTGNSATTTYGGVANNSSASPAGTIVLSNSIVAGNTDPTSDPANIDCYNCGTQDSHNLIGGAPMLSALGNYGGPTQTMLPLAGSPAIGAGSVALAVDTNSDPLTVDQRGTGFPRVVSGSIDLGAAEAADPATVTATAGTPQSTGFGSAFSVQLEATAKNPLGSVSPGATVTFTAPASGASGTFAGGSLTATAVTDSSGKATAPVFTANSTLGDFSVTASIATGATASFNLTNLQGAPAISWTPPSGSIVYGTTLAASLNPSATYNSAGVAGSYSYTARLGSGTDFAVTSSTVLPVGAYTLTATFTPTDDTDYTTATQTASLTVTAATLTVTADAATMPYGGPLPTLSGTLTGVVSGDNITATYSTDATAGSPVSGTYTVTPTLHDPDAKLTNYTVTNTPASFTITKVSLTVTANAATMPYGGPLPTLSGTLAGVISGDNITATYSTDATPSSPAGGAYTVTATLNDPGSRLANYTVANTSAAFTITKTPLTVIANAATMPYGGPLPALSGTVSGVVNSDNITATYSTNATITSAAGGTYAVTATLSDPGSKLGNYDVTNTPASFTITKADQTISFAQPTSPEDYSGQTITLSASASSTLPIGFTVISGPGSVSGSQLTVMGGGSIVVAADQPGDNNYTAAPSVQRTIVINAVAQTITFPPIPADVTFGSAASVTLAATSSSGLGVIYSVSGPATLSGSTLTYTGPGVVVITATQAGNSGYTAAAPVTQTTDVEAAFSTSGLAPNATSPPQTLLFTSTSAVTVGSLSVVTDGGPPDAFTITGGTCTANPTLTAGQTCTVTVTYIANSPGLTTGEVIVKDAGGNTIGTINLVALRYR